MRWGRPSPLEAAAAALDLRYLPGSLERLGGDLLGGQPLAWSSRMVGILDGLDVQVLLQGGRRRVLFRYGVSYPPLGLGLTVAPATPLRGRLAWRPGSRGVWLGSSFEERVRARSSAPEAARAVLDSNAVSAIMALAERLPDFVIKDRTLDAVERRGLFALPDPGEIVDGLWCCVRAAEALGTR